MGTYPIPFAREKIMRGMLLLAVGLFVFVSAGCAKKESNTSSSAEQGAPAAETTTPSAHGVESEQVNTSGSVADIVGRIHDQESQLDQIIASAQLKDVHKKAFAIRDLVAAAASQADASQKSALEPHVAEVRTIAGELDEAGDSGDLAKTKSQFQELKTHLRAIESVLGAAAH